MIKKLPDRSTLHQRHRLSHQQIDLLLPECEHTEAFREKIRQLDFVQQFVSIADIIRQHNIPFVCLKGALLSQRIYGDPTIRVSHDIDLLIEAKDLQKITDLLHDKGYESTDPSVWPLQKAQQDLFLKAFHHLSFFNKTNHILIEFHWRIIHLLPVEDTIIHDILKNNLTEEPLAGRRFTVLNKELELLFLMIHGSGHGWRRLKWLVDIKDYPIADVDTAKFYKLIKLLRAERILMQTNALLKIYFNYSLPFTVQSRIPYGFIPYAIRQIEDTRTPTNRSSMDIAREFLYAWKMFPGISYKLKLIGLNMFRPGDLAKIDSQKKIIYFLYRPYSIIRRRIFHA